MATEEGLVIAVENGAARIRTKQSTACESCASRSSCNAMGGGNDMEVEAVNTVGAKAGDTVILKIETTPLLKATFLIYILPILCLFAGAIIGQECARFFQLNASAVSVGVGFLFFIISLLFVRSKAHQMAGRADYKPTVLRIKKSASRKSSE